jgi:predicted GNAT family acetyltransferase
LLSPAQIEADGFGGGYITGPIPRVKVEPLTEAERDVALAFLSMRPVYTVIMAGWMQERGVESPEHRGRFYGSWNVQGILEGVALIGHATMFETTTDAALLAFAELARRDSSVRLVFAEDTELEKFWRAYAPEGRKPPMLCRELLYEKRAEGACAEKVISGVRRATQADVSQIAVAHAELISAETGENPLEKDKAGFIARRARRIEQGNTWVLRKGGELIFKADVVAETAEVVYVEGLWVNPRYRRKGYGKLCWNAMTAALLSAKQSICGFVNQENTPARAFYRAVGCRRRASFSKIFV